MPVRQGKLNAGGAFLALFVISLLSISLALAVWGPWDQEGGQALEPEGRPRVVGVDVQPQRVHTFELVPELAGRVAAEGQSGASTVMLSVPFAVIDATNGAPLEFFASCGREDVTVAIRGKGRLVLSAASSVWVTGFSFTLSAEHYRAREFSASSELARTLELEPTAISRVHVLDRHGVVRIGQVRFNAGGSRWAGDVVYESDGGVSFVHGSEQRALFFNVDGELVFEELISPGSDVWARIDGAGARVRLVEKDGTPVPGVEVELRWEGAAFTASPERISDAEGCVGVSGPHDAALSLELRSPGYRYAEGSVQAVGTTRVSGSELTLMPDLVEHWPADIILESAMNQVRVYDEATGEPVSGSAWLVKTVRPPSRNPVHLVMYGGDVANGIFRFPQGRDTPLSGGAASQGAEVSLAIAGYVPLLLDLDPSPFSPSLSRDLRLFVTRADPPKRLSITDRRGPLDAGVISVVDSTGELVFAGRASPDTTYGPFRTDDAAILVVAKGRGELGHAESSATRPSDYALDMDSSSGAIRVQSGQSPLPALVCTDLRGAEWAQSFNDRESCRFDSLPPGQYLVGPEAWIHQLRGIPGWATSRAVEVFAGRETVIEAVPEWVASAPVEGRIELSPGVDAPGVLLCYSDSHVVTKGVPSLWLDEQGRYEIPAGGPVPKSLALVELWGGRMRVRGLARPGTDTNLSEHVLTLIADPSQDTHETLELAFEQPGGWSGLPAGERLQSVDIRISMPPKGKVNLPIHESVRVVEVSRVREGTSFSIHLTGQHRQEWTLSSSR